MKDNQFRLNWIVFFIAFAIGISYVYFIVPTPKVVIKYPNPYNSNKLVYQDESDNCYKYKAQKVKCPEDNKLITPQPISA
jgi:hypothetical protein